MLIAKKEKLESKAWPFEEARRLVKRYEKNPPEKGYVLFETGYGPSGMPHIGTFGEVMRTTMVKHAFDNISDIPSKLICFSDDMDGLRKIPDNVPGNVGLEEDLNLPLTSVRDPFGLFDSFAQHNNSKLIEFLDQYDFDYEFISSTEYYREGYFDEALMRMLHTYSEVMAVMMPSIGSERQKTYSPFMPISKKTGHVLQVPTIECNPKKGTLIYEELDGEKVEILVTGGNVKLQWKPDWAMRWYALQVDYEMHGKDLIPSADLASKITKILGRNAPSLYNYELFLDDKGQKISKSKGNGLSMQEWLSYAEPSSLGLFMYQKPKTAKRLFFDIIPKTVEEYHQHLRSFEKQSEEDRLNNPVWHIHKGNPPTSDLLVSFPMLLNLASATGAENKETLWGFLSKYNNSVNPKDNPGLDLAASYAVKYYKDFVKPKKVYRFPSGKEKVALLNLSDELLKNINLTDAEDLQRIVYSVGKMNSFDPLRDWFLALYQILLGCSQGPRFGGFVALYGIEETVALIKLAVDGKLIK
jgi:lysyl-tRNA synthetase class 1